MANHDFVRAGNVWASLSDLTSAEMALLDFNAAHSIDDRGGTYALEEDMVIGGGVGITWDFELPVNFGEDVDILAPLYVSGATTIDATFAVLDDATLEGVTFNGAAEFENDVYFNGTAFLCQSQAVFLGTATFQDDAEFQEPVVFEDEATFDTDAVFDGDVYLNGTAVVCQSQISFSNTITGSGAGRIRARRVHRQAIGGNADASYAVTSYDHVHVPAATLSAPRTYTIDDTGSIDGDKMRFSSHDVGFSVAIHRPGGVALTSIKGDAKLSCDVERIGGLWKVTSCSATL